MKDIATFNTTTPSWDIITDPSLTDVYPQLRWGTDGLSQGGSVWVIGNSEVSLAYNLGILTDTYTYKGSNYNLSDLWDASSIFGANYSSWIYGTDYSFIYGGEQCNRICKCRNI